MLSQEFLFETGMRRRSRKSSSRGALQDRGDFLYRTGFDQIKKVVVVPALSRAAKHVSLLFLVDVEIENTRLADFPIVRSAALPEKPLHAFHDSFSESLSNL
jgi:hypothetical protein